MLCGQPPHYSKNKPQMLRDIVTKQVPMNSKLSQQAQSLLLLLLERDPNKRIGGFQDDFELDDTTP